MSDFRCTMASIDAGEVDHHGELELKLVLEVDDVIYQGSVYISREGWQGITEYFDGELERREEALSHRDYQKRKTKEDPT